MTELKGGKRMIIMWRFPERSRKAAQRLEAVVEDHCCVLSWNSFAVWSLRVRVFIRNIIIIAYDCPELCIRQIRPNGLV